MKHLLLSLALLFGVPALAKEKTGLPPNWQPVYEIKGNPKAFYDANSFIDINETTRAGIFMPVFDEPNKFNIGGKEFRAKTFVKSFIVECKKGIAAPVMELYFNEARPTLTSKPVAVFEYNPGAGLQPAGSDTYLHRFLCGPRV